MRGAPLLKLKFVNFVNNASAGASTAGVKESGLVGSVTGFNYSPDLDSGFFEGDRGHSVYPQALNLDCSFTVMHTHDLGENTGGGTRFPSNWPYNTPQEPPTPPPNKNSKTPPEPTAPVGSEQRKAAEAAEKLGGN